MYAGLQTITTVKMTPCWDKERRLVPQEEAVAPPQLSQLRPLRPFHELRDMTHEEKVFSMEQHINLYFHHIEVINDLIE